MRVALVNCRVLPEPDPDEAPLLDALARAGAEAESLAWDDPAADFAARDVLVLRATWNYYDRPADFVSWLSRPGVAPRLWNRPGYVRPNMHKGYLLDLEARGIPIVPTEIVRAGSTPDLAGLMDRRGWSEVVVKPAVSGGSRLTRRFSRADAERADGFVAPWLSGEDALVQPYLASIEGGPGRRPERAIVWIDGTVTHAIEKSPRFIGKPRAVHVPGELTPSDRAFAERVIERFGPGLLYARIDVMDGDSGETLLSELELIEPSLYFNDGPGSADRMASAIINAAKESGAR